MKETYKLTSSTYTAVDLYDTNLARRRLTQKYLLQVDHVLLVTNIMRAKTDASLSSSLYQDLLQHIPMEEVSAGLILKMAIVCTKIDVRRINIRGQNRGTLTSLRTSI